MTDWLRLAQAQRGRFMSKVRQSDTGCWLWSAGTDKDGYGKFQITNVHGAVPKQRHVRAHKLMLSLHRGDMLPDAVVVRHSCDNPLCVRPDHLIAGTQTENRKDCVDKRRHAFGATHGLAKLSAMDVERVRNHPPMKRGDLSRIARELGVTPSAVLDIIKGRSWKTMPAQRPGRSKQDYSTPTEFVDAVKKRFGVGSFAWDLAASKENTKANRFFSETENSLVQDWTALRGDLWLNCPYADIAPWAAKCAASARMTVVGSSRALRATSYQPHEGRRIFLLVPAAVGSNWFADYVDGKALVVFFRPRLSFDGISSYPKDCQLAIYGEKPGYVCWRWKESSR